MEKSLNLTNDILFKRVFGKKGNEDILKELLESILNIKIKEITVNKDVTLDVENLDGKIGIMDITAKLNNNVMVNIEMQVENEYNIVERSLFYWSRNVLFKFKKRKRLQRLYENNSNCNNGF